MVQRVATLTTYLNALAKDNDIVATATLDLAMFVDHVLEQVMLRADAGLDSKEDSAMLGRHWQDAFLYLIRRDLQGGFLK